MVAIIRPTSRRIIIPGCLKITVMKIIELPHILKSAQVFDVLPEAVHVTTSLLIKFLTFIIN